MLLFVVFLHFLSIVNLSLCVPSLELGEICPLEGDNVGKCRDLHDCPSAITDLKFKKHPKTCSFNGFTPIVCCRNTSTTNNVSEEEESPNYGKVSSTKCESYAGLVFQNYSSPTLLPDVLFEIEDTCAIKAENYKESSILAREFPHLASVGYDSALGQVWKCSGALISEKFVLTAAACYNLTKLGLAKYVRVGSTSARENFYNEKPLQYFNIQKFMRHPTFDEATLENNLALIKLDNPVQFTSIVRPACLRVTQKRPQEAMNVGWGTLNNDRYLNNEPVKSLVKIMERQKCLGVEDNEFCVRQGPGSIWQRCTADLGGVLQVYNEDNYCTYDIIGVVNEWRYCLSDSLGVYTNITGYLPWIQKNVWG